MMKRLFLILAIAVATVCNLQAGQIDEAAARHLADQFFSARSARFTASAGQTATRLAYTAEQGRFYVFDRSNHGGFVVVAGDDRLPQVLGYGETGDFSSAVLPDAVQYWLDAMNKQIAYLQSHGGVAVHQPAKRVAAVAPLLTTRWDQGAPYNNYCPTYTSPAGNTGRAVTGCVATAVAQVMNYYQWPDVGRGSHSYWCNVNDMTNTELSADFSQSVYQWDLMLDEYDKNSSPESCDAVARLMSDVGISMDMGYGTSSGASESVAMHSMTRYFKYTDKCYILNRDYYGAEEWDQYMVNELVAGRPVIYCGYYYGMDGGGGHAFVLDGVDNDGYYHVNWGWGGSYDGYFLVSVLAPGGMDFKYMQDGIFGLVPEAQSDAVDDVMYIHSQLIPRTTSAQLGSQIILVMDNFMVEGNMLDTVGYEERNGRKAYYDLIEMSLSLFDQNGNECKSDHFTCQQYLDPRWSWGGRYLYFDLPQSLEDGDYKMKLSYSLDDGVNYDHPVLDFSGEDLYVKMRVRDGMAYLTDCFLSNTYEVQSIAVSSGVMANQPFTADVTLLYDTWGEQDGPVGNVYLSLLKDGIEVASSDMCEVMLHGNVEKTYQMQMTAPAEWGRYELALCDESGNRMERMENWIGSEVVTVPVFVLPVCDELVEDFESMTANSSTTDKNVQGQFTTWNFSKCGVRAPGEDLCNGTNSVMMKKPSSITTAQSLSHHFIIAQATFINPVSSLAKYTLKYSLDDCVTWQTARTIDDLEAAEVEGKTQSRVTWMLDLSAAQPVYFRISMIGGGGGATYVDDVSFYYIDPKCDVNGDGEITIADVNMVIDAILSNSDQLSIAADVNNDGIINIIDINTIIDVMLAQ